jgi:hypothetical protein
VAGDRGTTRSSSHRATLAASPPTREASTDAFRLALIVAASLLAAGAAVNRIRLRGPDE